MAIDPIPFTQLKQPRQVDAVWLPQDLRDFYSTREGVGRESTPERLVRLCTLAELRRIKWADLHIFGRGKPEQGWEDFSAIRLGIGSFFEEIIWVLSAPSAPPGSIMAIGVDVAGPGGTGENTLEYSVVLSEDFDHWITRLSQDGWWDFGLGGGIGDEPPERQKELRARFKRLNPSITWGDDK